MHNAVTWQNLGKAIQSIIYIYPKILEQTSSVSQKIPLRTCGYFSKTVRNFSTKFYVPILRSYLRYITHFCSVICNFDEVMPCHIKRDHIMRAKCPPSAETHAGIFWHFSQTVRIFSPNFTHLLSVPMYARMPIFIQLSQTLTKLCHIKCDHPACVSVDDGHFEHIMVVALNMV